MKWYDSEVAFWAVMFIGIWGCLIIIGAIIILASIYGC